MRLTIDHFLLSYCSVRHKRRGYIDIASDYVTSSLEKPTIMLYNEATQGVGMMLGYFINLISQSDDIEAGKKRNNFNMY